MIIELGKVSEDGSQYVGEDAESILGLEEQKRVRVTSPVRYDLFVEKLGTELIVRGTIEVDMDIECGRCTDFFSTTVSDSSFLRAYEISEKTETVDVTPDIREDILLDMPAYPLCSQECKGLCAQCGTNLNREQCACKQAVKEENRWAELNRLKLS